MELVVDCDSPGDSPCPQKLTDVSYRMFTSSSDILTFPVVISPY